MKKPAHLVTTLLLAGWAGWPAAAQPAPASPPPGSPTPLQRFMALPPDRQEAIRTKIQPLFAQSLDANGRLIRMAQDCNMPLPQEATPAERLEHDLSSPDDSTAQLLGRPRQGALLSRFRGAMQASIDCRVAGEMRPRLIAQLAGFGPAFRQTLEQELGGPVAGAAPATAPPAVAKPAAPAAPPEAKPPAAN